MTTSPGPRWLIDADDALSDAGSPTVGLAMDLDPRVPSLRLGVRILSGGTADVLGGAIYRRFFPGDRADWSASLDWLARPAAAELLATILDGYRAEVLWSGDCSARWTPAALAAADQLHTEISYRIISRDDTGKPS